MHNRREKINSSAMEVQVIINDIRPEIDLDNAELLRLEFGQPGTRVMCTAGTLWLTQQGDPQDYLLQAGQSFTLNQGGIVLVQGLPCGKARIQPLATQGASNAQNIEACRAMSQPD
jgi:hypothetical protein